MSIQWRGVFPAAVTHYKADQSLDIPATLKHVDQMIDAGIHGLIMLGSVGENCAHEYNEKIEVLSATIKHVAGRVPVMSGVAECSTKLACRFASDAAKLGADGLMVLPVMIYKSDPRETLYHFRQVAAASDLPIMIYNNPPPMASISSQRCLLNWQATRSLLPSKNRAIILDESPIW